MSRCVVLLAICLAAPGLLADELSGGWKHADQPVWIAIRLATGSGTVVRHDSYPERVGSELLKDVEISTAAANQWQGLVYAEQLNEYKPVTILLRAPDDMQFTVKVGFISRTINWRRADEDAESAP